MHCVIETEVFSKSSRRMRLSEDDRLKITTYMSSNPDAGDLIPGTGGARKRRFPFGNKGKRGGARVVSFFAGDDVPVFLLDIYAKGEQIRLSEAEKNELKKILGGIADSYRESVRRKVANLSEIA